MTFVWLAIALWVFLIIDRLCCRFAEFLHRPLTETDLYCSRVDAELDELEARRRTRPLTTGCEVIPFRPRERTRGDVS